MRGATLHHFEGAGSGPHGTRWAWFAVWGVLGAATGIAGIVFPPSVLLMAVLGALLYRVRDARDSAFGLVSGVGVALLIVAWIQRQGPGTTCWHTATASGCDQHLNPIPWLVAGIVLVVAGVLAVRRRRG